jgi:hypothetical protein
VASLKVERKVTNRERIYLTFYRNRGKTIEKEKIFPFNQGEYIDQNPRIKSKTRGKCYLIEKTAKCLNCSDKKIERTGILQDKKLALFKNPIINIHRKFQHHFYIKIFNPSSSNAIRKRGHQTDETENEKRKDQV